MKRNLRLLATIAAISVPAVTALAEDVFIKQPTVTVRAGKGAVYDEVATVKKGDRLSVIAREGKWLKVKVGPREGYVFETAVGDRPTGGDSGGLSKLMGAGSGTGTASDTAAGRGLGESLVWARGNNMDPSGLNKMLAARKRVSPQEWEKFTAEGKVGPAKPQ
jgi:Bacterial SH3 domain